MRTHRYVSAALVAASLVVSQAQAAQVLLPPTQRDQAATRLVSLPAPAGEFERAPVTFAWKLDPHAPLSASPPHVAESREYWQTVEGAELRRGVEVTTTAPGAVIRLSPARGSAALRATDIAVGNNRGPARLEQLANAEELRAAGMDTDDGTAVVKLADEHVAGRYSLRASQASGRYVVHVFEPRSDVLLEAATNRSHVLGGDTIGLSVTMSRAGRALSTNAEALLVAPDGESRPITVARGRGGELVADVRLPLHASAAPGLWELQVFANADGVPRDARTAFAVAAPTARFGVEAATDARRLRLTVPVVTASPGRYEVRGTLYATGPDGIARPVSRAHAARWIERGATRLALAFDRSHVPDGFGAPFEVRQLGLFDQTRMAPLETREHAVRF